MSAPDGGEADASGDGGLPGSDGSTPGATWSAPTLIPGMSVPVTGDSMATLREDMCEMYFVSDRDGNYDIYVSTRFTVNDPWGTPTRVAELSSTVTDSGPELSADGKTIWIARNTSANSFEIMVATRNSPTDTWSMPTAVPELSSTYADRSPQVTSDGKTLFWVRNNGAGPDTELWTATWSNASSSWTNLREVNKLNSTLNEENPTTIGDGLEIYFDRDDVVYRSTRPVGGAWDPPAVVPELAGALRTEVSADGTYMVLAMLAADGSSDLYESHRN